MLMVYLCRYLEGRRNLTPMSEQAPSLALACLGLARALVGYVSAQRSAQRGGQERPEVARGPGRDS